MPWRAAKGYAYIEFAEVEAVDAAVARVGLQGAHAQDLSKAYEHRGLWQGEERQGKGKGKKGKGKGKGKGYGAWYKPRSGKGKGYSPY